MSQNGILFLEMITKLVTIKLIEMNALSGGKYLVNKSIRIQTPTLRANLCNIGTYFVVKRNRTLQILPIIT